MNGNVVSIDINMFWQIINFFILVFVFNKYFKKPLGKMLDKRKSQITGDLENAEKAKDAARMLQEQSQEILKQAKQEALDILKTAEKKADERREAIIVSAKDQREKILRAAELEAIKMKSDARASIQEEAKLLAIEIAEKLIKEKINSNIESTLIDDFVEEVGDKTC